MQKSWPCLFPIQQRQQYHDQMPCYWDYFEITCSISHHQILVILVYSLALTNFVVDTLNKLEAGSNEKIMLMSRDEQTLMVVGFKDLKKAIVQGFNKLSYET